MVINYWLSFVWYGNSKILKLLILSNERGFNSKITVPWQPLLLPLINGITVYYRFILLNSYRSTPIAHAWAIVLHQTRLESLASNKHSNLLDLQMKNLPGFVDLRPYLICRQSWLLQFSILFSIFCCRRCWESKNFIIDLNSQWI